jgi:hypothetical protein
MNHKELFGLLKTIKKNIRCPQCGKEYDFSQIRIRGIAESIVFLELSCPDHMPVLATVALNSKFEAAQSVQQKVVNSDDVIETYKFLEKFSGGFENIFQKQGKAK